MKAVAGVTITNSDKVWWPDDGITKLEIAEHYARCGSAFKLGRAACKVIDRPRNTALPFANAAFDVVP